MDKVKALEKQLRDVLNQKMSVKELLDAQFAAAESFVSKLIIVYVSEKFAALFDKGTAWLSKLVVPGLSTLVDVVSAAGFFLAEQIGSNIMSAIGQVWNAVQSAAQERRRAARHDPPCRG